MGKTSATQLTNTNNNQSFMRNENRFRQVFEEAPIGMTLAGKDFKLTKVNAAFCAWIGYSADELRSLTFLDITYPDDVPASRENMGKLIRGEIPKYAAEKRYIRKDGTVLWASLTASIFRDAQGAFLSTFAIIIDITDRKKAEIALRESEAKLKAVLDETPVAINLSDAAGNIEYVNAQFRALFGYSAEEIPTTQQWLLHAYPDPTYRAWVLSGRQEAIDRTRRVGVDTMPRELKITDKDGTTRWVTAAIAQAADKTITIFHDITGRKRAEEALKESNVKLEQSLNSTIEAIGVVSERRDPFTAGHQKRVAVLAVALADEMSLTKDQVRCVQVAALLHDVGKVNVPGEILSKPGILSAVEFKVVTTYPEASYEILKTTAYPWPVAEVVLQHQERLNGSGYPRGLVGKDIMIEARILAVADVVEAMTAHRPYRTALTIETALEELAQNKGILFDPAVVDACARLFRDRGFAFGRDQNKVPAQAR